MEKPTTQEDSFKSFLQTLSAGQILPSYYTHNEPFIIEEINLESKKIKLRQKNLPSHSGRWFSEIDFCKTSPIH